MGNHTSTVRRLLRYRHEGELNIDIGEVYLRRRIEADQVCRSYGVTRPVSLTHRADHVLGLIKQEPREKAGSKKRRRQIRNRRILNDFLILVQAVRLWRDFNERGGG